MAVQSFSPNRETLAKLIQLPLCVFAGINACRLTICQADQLAMQPETAYGGKWRTAKDPDAGSEGRTVTTQVAVHITEHRGSSGLGVSRTPRAWRAKSSKTLTADDNNFILMQRLGHESPSRGSEATHCLCIFARENYTVRGLYLTSIIPSATAGATAEVNLVWSFGTELGSSPYTIEFRTKLSLWCHRQRSPLS